MTSKQSRRVLPVILSLVIAACGGSTPVRNIDNAPITATGANVGLTQIKRAISTACQSNGWRIKDAGQHQIIATRYLDGKIATTQISYSKHSYSIAYADSSNLGYDGSTISAEYNDWIGELDREIRQRLNNH